jgi:hypothetical protein
MNILSKTNHLRDRVRSHGNYRVLADQSGVKFDWLTKFARGKIPNPGVVSVSKLETFFGEPEADKCGGTR